MRDKENIWVNVCNYSLYLLTPSRHRNSIRNGRIYELDGTLEAVGVHPFCSDSCRDTHTGKILGPIRVGEDNGGFIGLSCEECGRELGGTFDRYLRFRCLCTRLNSDGAFVIVRDQGVLKTYFEQDHEVTFASLLHPLDGDLLEI